VKKAKEVEQVKKRFFAACTYCGNKFESDEPIEPCCMSITQNDRKLLKSEYKARK